LLVLQKLAERQSAQMSQQEKLSWQQHNNLERGNPKKVFKGEQFKQ
jgi:peptide chain release factor